MRDLRKNSIDMPAFCAMSYLEPGITASMLLHAVLTDDVAKPDR